MPLVTDSTAVSALRREIDAIDDDLMRLLSRRFDVCMRISRLKGTLGLPVVVQDREEHVLDRIASRAGEREIPPEFARRLWRVIIEQAREVENDTMSRERNDHR
jgi:isochorismate pyruvate lyase